VSVSPSGSAQGNITSAMGMARRSSTAVAARIKISRSVTTPTGRWFCTTTAAPRARWRMAAIAVARPASGESVRAGPRGISVTRTSRRRPSTATGSAASLPATSLLSAQRSPTTGSSATSLILSTSKSNIRPAS